MTHRVLPREEWARLDGTLLWPAARTFDPEARVMVVERDGEILACAAYYPQWHLDGVWIRSTAPKASVGRRLLRLVRDGARELGLSHVWAMVASDRSRKLVRALGPVFQFECDHYEIDVRGK